MDAHGPVGGAGTPCCNTVGFLGIKLGVPSFLGHTMQYTKYKIHVCLVNSSIRYYILLAGAGGATVHGGAGGGVDGREPADQPPLLPRPSHQPCPS